MGSVRDQQCSLCNCYRPTIQTCKKAFCPFKILTVCPFISEICHSVAKTFNLHSTQLAVHGEVGQVHGTGSLDGQPHTTQDLASMHYPKKIIYTGCFFFNGTKVLLNG